MRTPAPAVPNSLYLEVKEYEENPLHRLQGHSGILYHIDYKAIPEFCTINEVCRLFEVSKRELQELCETYDVQPRRNEIGEYGFVSYDVRKLHNLAYHSSREDRREDPWA